MPAAVVRVRGKRAIYGSSGIRTMIGVLLVQWSRPHSVVFTASCTVTRSAQQGMPAVHDGWVAYCAMELAHECREPHGGDEERLHDARGVYRDELPDDRGAYRAMPRASVGGIRAVRTSHSLADGICTAGIPCCVLHGRCPYLADGLACEGITAPCWIHQCAMVAHSSHP